MRALSGGIAMENEASQRDFSLIFVPPYRRKQTQMARAARGGRRGEGGGRDRARSLARYVRAGIGGRRYQPDYTVPADPQFSESPASRAPLALRTFSSSDYRASRTGIYRGGTRKSSPLPSISLDFHPCSRASARSRVG